MKKVAIILIIVALALTGCDKKTKIGGKEILEGVDQISESPTPTPTKSKSKRPSATPTKTKSKPPTTKINTEIIKIENVNDQYQPRERVLYIGDVLIFKNLDPSSKHSLTEGLNQSEKSPAFDSKILSNGQEWKWTVDVAPGNYSFHCEVVPYIQGGPIKVLKRPT